MLQEERFWERKRENRRATKRGSAGLADVYTEHVLAFKDCKHNRIKQNAGF